MTTRTWSTTTSCNNDAEFRALGLELSTRFAEVGLVQTSDTGQINWSTVARPTAADATAGYEIWRFSDALQATAPIFIKIIYGNYGTAGVFGFHIQVGTGSNGSGTLTGTTSTQSQCGSSSFGAYNVGTFPTYLCYKDGFLGLNYKMGAWWSANANSQAGFAISRTCDSSGTWTADGCVIYTRNIGNDLLDNQEASVQALRFAATAVAYTKVVGGYCLVPHARTATLGADNPVYAHWMPIPQTVPVLGVCTHVSAHYGSVGTFNIAMVGAAPRTYLSFGGAKWIGRGSQGVGGYAIAMLWE